ncbi:MAG: TatD family hydrolase [Candidatus Rokubacteria bacterium]|nr:TatD family hydrolase [Candidatus Rokubacteria bacterium]MBI3827365.1 TatD family hydrolase [Candidatus Rokubacteria bacterium]
MSLAPDKETLGAMVIDSHCHLHDPAFADVRETVTTALAHDVWGVVAVGCDPDSNETTLARAAALPKAIWPCLGLHPDWDKLGDAELERVEAQLARYHARIVALGEVGLPWYSLEGAADAAGRMARGLARLERLLALAVRYDLPVVLHAPHGAAGTALEALRRRGVERAVFHWHKAPAAITGAIVEAGYLISVTPEVVYRDRDRELVEAVPLASLLVESDAPWPYRGEFEGRPSGPWLAARAAEEVAKIKRLPVDDVMRQLCANTVSFFDLPWR